jgi:hypothetical protein
MLFIGDRYFMRGLTTLVCISAVSLVSACGAPYGGYYDDNGNYVSYEHYNKEARAYEPTPAGYTNNPRYDDSRPTYTTTTTYDRPGYYDYYGHYIDRDEDFGVPEDMFPPRGMCRVWLPNRSPVHQPPVESCDGIRSRVPVGAYVIYGG